MKITLIGDDCIDQYQYGNVDRLSAEAPVPIFDYKHTVTKPGMAANVNENLLALGCKVDFYKAFTSRKIRLIDERSKHHICRIDHDEMSMPLMYPDINFTGSDAIVISDYNKGTVSYKLIENLKANFGGPIFIDTKKTDLSRMDGCFVKINEPEWKAATSACDNLIVTRGSESVKLYNGLGCEQFDVLSVPVFDVCGAGDTFLASLAYYYVRTYDIKDSIKFAIRAASITVQHIGAYAPTLKEINHAP
jgi:D-beta-D-heptose 7-phosphate kinase/D-beta-D-heptose 1-phosphate adenosyltransferase